VPNAGADNHILIQGSAANWSEITSISFLGDPKPGQDQMLIKSGDQTAKVAAGQSLSEIQKKLWTHIYDEDEVRELDQNKNENVTIIGNRTISVTKDIDESAKMKINIKAGVELTLEGPGGMIKIDATGVTIQGVLVKIN
jgi:hypothetical protein